MQMSDYTAIIPARGGSIGLPGKNKRILCDHPLVAWSILFAKASQVFSNIYVTTDDPDIAAISSDYGASVPFLRSNSLSTGTAKSSDVILDVINRCGLDPHSIFVLLEPTSPFRTQSDLQSLINYFEDPTVNKVVSVTEAVSSAPPFCYQLDCSSSTLHKRPFIDATRELRRQDIDKYHFLDGSFYASRVSAFIDSPTFTNTTTSTIVSNYFSSFEIDTFDDFQLFEYIMSSIDLSSFYNP